MTSYKRFDDITLEAAEKLAQKLKPEDFAVLLSKYAGNPDDLVHVKSIFSGLGKTFVNPKYGTEAVELAKSADVIDAKYLGKYLNGLASIDDLALVSVKQGFEVSKFAQQYSFDIHIAGRWADTVDDINLRALVAKIADPLVAQRLNLPIDQLPENIRQLISQYPNVNDRNKIIEFWTRQEVVQTFNAQHNTNLAFFQARNSSGKPEVDVFVNIEYAQWQNFDTTQLETMLREQFDVTHDPLFEVDFYNDDWTEWNDALGLTDPRITPPPGSILIKPDGQIVHPSLRTIP